MRNWDPPYQRGLNGPRTSFAPPENFTTLESPFPIGKRGGKIFRRERVRDPWITPEKEEPKFRMITDYRYVGVI